jgi:aminoglycoside phosphotransferase (APT) family kinase protein
LQRFLPELKEAAAAADVGGDRLLHLDVRSDNVCLREGVAILVDWNWACVGDPLFEVAAWLPSLHAEGGPSPEEVLAPGTPGLDAFAALLAGYFCAHAVKPPIPEAPHVRPLQLAQARTALPWAARALGLSQPG